MDSRTSPICRLACSTGRERDRGQGYHGHRRIVRCYRPSITPERSLLNASNLPPQTTPRSPARGAHNRLGLAYQMGFLRLTGRFPAQQPLELVNDLLVFVAREVAIDPAAIQAYAQRRQTVSEHQHLLRLHLGFRPFGPAERDALCHFLLEDALRLEHTPALVARAEEFLRDRRILLPAGSTLRRLVGEQREQARHRVYTRLTALMPPEMPARLDALLQVEEPQRSLLQALKAKHGQDLLALGHIW
jgi:hypothetical protein